MEDYNRIYQVVSQRINEADPMGLLKDRKDVSVNYGKQIEFICDRIKECPHISSLQLLCVCSFMIDFPVSSVYPISKYGGAAKNIFEDLSDILPVP